jgi:hypothetical protein
MENILMGLVKVKNVLDITADTVADLANVQHKTGSIQLLGFHTKGDGGGGVFYWDATKDKSEHNGGTVIDPDKAGLVANWASTQALYFTPDVTGQGCWVREYSGAVNVKWFGAKGDGVADDSLPTQSALTNSNKIYIPKGNFKIGSASNVRGLLLKSGNNIVGDGELSKLMYTTSTTYLLSANPIDNDNGTSSLADNVKNINITNVHFFSSVNTFDEFKHILNLNAVSNVLIDSCLFTGWMGDAVYVGSGNTGLEERHNQNVVIKNCYFDGVNKLNRNAVSIIDGDSIIIDGNYFTRCSDLYMPGPIDIEPNSNAYHVVKNISIINNTFEDFGGQGCVSFALPGVDFTTTPKNFTIANNQMNCGDRHRAIYFVYNKTDTSDVYNSTFEPMNINITGNKVTGALWAFQISGIKGCKIESNFFYDILNSGILYRFDGNHCRDVSFYCNTFEKVGTTTQDTALNSAISVSNIRELIVKGNVFKDIGRSTGGNGICMYFRDFGVTTESKNVIITDNIFLDDAGVTSQSVKVDPSHSTDSLLNRINGNVGTTTLPIGLPSNKAGVYVDKTSSVNTTTTYTNANKSLSVQVRVDNSTASTSTFLVDGVAVSYITPNAVGMHSVVVPPHSTYRMPLGTIVSWKEYSI